MPVHTAYLHVFTFSSAPHSNPTLTPNPQAFELHVFSNWGDPSGVGLTGVRGLNSRSAPALRPHPRLSSMRSLTPHPPHTHASLEEFSLPMPVVAYFLGSTIHPGMYGAELLASYGR